MAIKHLGWYTSEELKKKKDIPIWKRRDVLLSPLIIFIGIGYFIYYIIYGTFFLIKWSLLSWIAPFFYWKGFCKIGLHKWRGTGNYDEFNCIICQKTKTLFTL